MNLDDLYFKDNFTKEGEKVDLEINKLTTTCITSKNNRFSLDGNGNLSVNSITTEVPIVTESQIDVLYPVGSIYMNVNPINPNVVLGGSWEQIKDRFLLACGNSFANGTMGGEINHTLTVSEMPSHNHSGLFDNTGELKQDYSFRKGSDGCAMSKYRNDPLSTPSVGHTGGSQPHNNMPPYLAVYVWKRIA